MLAVALPRIFVALLLPRLVVRHTGLDACSKRPNSQLTFNCARKIMFTCLRGPEQARAPGPGLHAELDVRAPLFDLPSSYELAARLLLSD